MSALIVEGITAKRTSAKRKVLKAFFMEQFSLVQMTAHYLAATQVEARLRPICLYLLTPSKPVTCGHCPVLTRVCATTKHCSFSVPAFWLELADLCFATMLGGIAGSASTDIAGRSSLEGTVLLAGGSVAAPVFRFGTTGLSDSTTLGGSRRSHKKRMVTSQGNTSRSVQKAPGRTLFLAPPRRDWLKRNWL